jgi:hypothetical protein
VTWSETVIHAEAQFSAPNSMGICTFLSRKDLPNNDRFRFVVGSHIPTGLNTDSLGKLAHHCEKGLIPDFYFSHNSGTKVWNNIKNGKSTQYKRPREISDAERTYVTEALAEDGSNVESMVREMPPLKKHLYGISQNIDTLLEFSETDRTMLQRLF